MLLFVICLSAFAVYCAIVALFSGAGRRRDVVRGRIESLAEDPKSRFRIDEELEQPFAERFLKPIAVSFGQLFQRLVPERLRRAEQDRSQEKSRRDAQLQKLLSQAGLSLSPSNYRLLRLMIMQWYFDGLKEEATDGRTFTTASSTTVRTWEKNWETLTLDGYNIIDGDFKTSGLVVVNGVLIVNGDYDAAGLMVATGSTLIVNGDLSWGGYGTYLPRFQDATVYVTGSIDARPGGYGTTFTGSNAIYAGQNMTQSPFVQILCSLYSVHCPIIGTITG